MFWFRYSFGLTFSFLNVACAKRSVQLPFGTATVLPSSHLSASFGEPNCGASFRARKMLHWSNASPRFATRRMSAVSVLVVDTIAGMSPM